MYIKDMLKEHKELLIIFTALSKLHEKYGRDISQEELSLYVVMNALPKDVDVLSDILAEIADTADTSEIIEDLLVENKQRHDAYQLALLALEVSEGRSSITDLMSATSTFEKESQITQPSGIEFVTHDLNDLLDTTCNVVGLRWRLDCLNKSLGSLRKGDFGFIFARPETGKTTFLASEVSYMLDQTRATNLGPVLWFNNEEQGEKVMLRIYQALYGIALPKLLADKSAYRDDFRSKYGDFLHMVDSATIHRRDIEKLCEQYKPSLIVSDQLDKLKGFSGDLRDDLRLGEIYIWSREIAKEYCPVIGVSQSDASGEGKRWLTMENVANAKTAKQAEADWILGIGKSHDPVEEYIRFLCINKNKLTGDLDTDPTLRHARLTVSILPDIARYGDFS